MGIDYTERIPNNVDLPQDRRLHRALETGAPLAGHCHALGGERQTVVGEAVLGQFAHRVAGQQMGRPVSRKQTDRIVKAGV
mgnify:CR=1 FL=1